jgi:poly(3-hydroxybutyrate) depolymerase
MTYSNLFRRCPAMLIVISVALAVSTAAAVSVDDPVIFSLDRSAGSTIHDRDPGYRPLYLVYADTQRTAEEAKKLVDDLGMTQNLDAYKTRVFVVGPSNGTAYDDTADLTAYQNFLKSHRSSNLKIVAVGAGATFVNNVISKHAYSVAGILAYGGSIASGSVSNMPVPAYVHATNPAVSKHYIQANGATAKSNAASWTTYTNPGPYKGLQRVVVSKLSDAKENLSQAFANAWKTVFSHNYRFYMSLIESYNPAFDPLKYTEPWELEPYVMYDELGMSYQAIAQNMPGFGMSLWYEYVPKTALTAKPKSVPLVIMLHGNGNDPRTQGESGGWPEVAAKNNIILASIEWQGRGGAGRGAPGRGPQGAPPQGAPPKVAPPQGAPPQGAPPQGAPPQGPTYIALGEKGTMAVLDLLLAKYPQIDPSRVYFTGLSAGAMNSFNWGINNVARIAGVAGSSAPFGTAALIENAKKVKANGNYLPMYSVAGNRDQYKPLPVNDTPRSFYSIIRAYAALDDITVPDVPDLKVNELFGLKLDGTGWGELGGTRAMIGTLSNSQGVMIKLVGLDPYAHWNYKPAAADAWAFLSRYRRDLTTGKLVVARGK